MNGRHVRFRRATQNPAYRPADELNEGSMGNHRALATSGVNEGDAPVMFATIRKADVGARCFRGCARLRVTFSRGSSSLPDDARYRAAWGANPGDDMKTASLLLAGTALVALGFHSLPAGAVEQSFVVAQANPKPDAEPRTRAQQRQDRLDRQEQRQQQQAPAVRSSSNPRRRLKPPFRRPRRRPHRPKRLRPRHKSIATLSKTHRGPKARPLIRRRRPPHRTSSARPRPRSGMTGARTPIATIAGPRRSSSLREQERSTQQSPTPQNDRGRNNQNADTPRDRQ